jgi:hypothetical protein
MLRRAIGPVALVVAVAVVGWLITGVALFDIIKFLAYDAVFVALPGAALLWAVRGRRSHFLVTIALGWPLGQALEILAFSATAAIGVRGLFLLYPLVVIIPSALLILRRRSIVEEDPDPEGMSRALMWAVAAALCLGLVYLTIMFLPQAPLPTSTVLPEYPDFPYFLGLIAQIRYHWPPTSAGLSGVALPYEWFVFFHMAAVNQVTGVSIPVIALRLDYVPTVLVVACQLLAVGRFVGRAAWTGAIAVGIVFLLGPLDLVATATQTPFGNNVLVHLWDSWTFPFGLMFFLALIYLVTERFRATTWRAPRDIASWVLIALLMIGASGAKATVLPDIVVGAGLYVIAHLVIRRSVPISAVLATSLGIVLFIATYAVIYAGSAPDTVITFLVWLSGTPPVVLANGIHHALLRDVLLPLAYAAALVGLLLPLCGMAYLLRRRHRHEIPRYALLVCLLVAGVLIASVVHQSSYSEGYFEETAYVAGAIAAAAGVRLAWLDAGYSVPFTRRGVVATFVVSFVALLALVKITAHWVFTPERTSLLYLGIAAAIAIFVIATTLVLRLGRASASGAAALGLIPMLAAAALTQPTLVYPTARLAVSGAPLTPGPPVVASGLLTALYWLQDHAPINAVFAVNNHWIGVGMGNGKYYYYTAFAERQIFIEAYDPIRYGITPGIATRTAAIFAYRQQLNDAVFDHADASALHTMTRQYSVRFLFIDRLRGPVDAAVLGFGRVVFSNADAVILAVG